MPRIPLSPLENEELLELIANYKHARDQQHENEEDAKEYAQKIMSMFKAHGIGEKKINLDNALIRVFIAKHVSYKPSPSLKYRIKHDKNTKRIETEMIRTQKII